MLSSSATQAPYRTVSGTSRCSGYGSNTLVVGLSGQAGSFRMSVRRPGGLAEEMLTYSINGAVFEVYGELGYGFLESVYLSALERELRNRGHAAARELSVRVMYKSEEIAWHRLDMVVDGTVVIEVKAGPLLHPTAER